MKKQNMPLAMEILKDEQCHTRFWFAAFVTVLVVAVLSHIVKGGVKA